MNDCRCRRPHRQFAHDYDVARAAEGSTLGRIEFELPGPLDDNPSHAGVDVHDDVFGHDSDVARSGNVAAPGGWVAPQRASRPGASPTGLLPPCGLGRRRQETWHGGGSDGDHSGVASESKEASTVELRFVGQIDAGFRSLAVHVIGNRLASARL